jgi:[ribosomal protein S5]-alanine N-acetyltransferase
LCDYLFDQTAVERIEAVVRTDNPGERRALEQIGFSCDAVLARAQFKQGQWRDVVLDGMVRSSRVTA